MIKRYSPGWGKEYELKSIDDLTEKEREQIPQEFRIYYDSIHIENADRYLMWIKEAYENLYQTFDIQDESTYNGSMEEMIDAFEKNKLRLFILGKVLYSINGTSISVLSSVGGYREV